MKILISAAETSSDAHGAQLLRALRKISAEPIEAFGIGGPKLQAEGLRVVVDARELMAMGFTEILGHLPRIFRALKRIEIEAIESKPDLAVVIDYPDFHFRLAKRLSGIPLIYFIPPKVWVWRKSRITVLRERFKKILVIFPFEEKIYSHENVPVKYVGNPLFDELPTGLSKEDARKKLGIDLKRPTLLLMPGSRRSELDAHFELFLEAAAEIAEKLSDRLQVLVPLPEMGDAPPEWKEKFSTLPFDVKVSRGDSHLCAIAADVGIIKSGTSTLEAGLLGLPHVIVYKPTKASELIFKILIRYKGPVGLVNLVAGEGPDTKKPFLAPEILMDEVNVENIVRPALELFLNSEKRSSMLAALRGLREKVALKQSPSETAAKEILEVYRELRK